MNKKSASAERRLTRRKPIRVLVQCLPPGSKLKKNGPPTRGWEMWARNIADDGVGLRWIRQWAMRDYDPDFMTIDAKPKSRLSDSSPAAYIKKGHDITLEGLVYTENGSKPMRGRVQWVRSGKTGDIVDFGVHITTPSHRSFFKALEG